VAARRQHRRGAWGGGRAVVCPGTSSVSVRENEKASEESECVGERDSNMALPVPVLCACDCDCMHSYSYRVARHPVAETIGIGIEIGIGRRGRTRV